MTRAPHDPPLTRTEDEESLTAGDPAPSTELEPLATALRAAWRPEPLEPDVLEALVAAALAEPHAPVVSLEERAASQLGDTLDAGEPGTDRGSREAALAATLRAAWSPDPPASAVVEAAVEAALRPALPSAARRSRAWWRRAGAGALGGVLALAAAVTLLLTNGAPAPSASPLHLARSTAPLFAERFGFGQTSARLDRIVSVRERELRDNRYARWGLP